MDSVLVNGKEVIQYSIYFHPGRVVSHNDEAPTRSLQRVRYFRHKHNRYESGTSTNESSSSMSHACVKFGARPSMPVVWYSIVPYSLDLNLPLSEKGQQKNSRNHFSL